MLFISPSVCHLFRLSAKSSRILPPNSLGVSSERCLERTVRSVDIATRNGLDGPGDRISVGATFSAPVQTGPGAHPTSYTLGTWLFPGVKRPERGVYHPSSSSSEVKERVELYIFSLPPILGFQGMLQCKLCFISEHSPCHKLWY